MRWFVFFLLLMAGSVRAQPIDSTEWATYMQHNRLYWDSLGPDFYDGIIAGNGRLGVNLYRENAKAIRFDIGRSDVTDQRPHYPDSMFTQQLVSHPRLPIGKMVIRTENIITGASIFLDLYNAEAKGFIKTAKGMVEVYFLVPKGEEVVHIELGEQGSEKIICEWTGEKAMTPRISYGRVKPEEYGYEPNPDFTLKDSAGYGICYQPLLYDGEYATVWTHALEKGKHVIDVSVGYNSKSKGTAIREAISYLRAFKANTFLQTINVHRKQWNRFFQKSFIRAWR